MVIRIGKYLLLLTVIGLHTCKPHDPSPHVTLTILNEDKLPLKHAGVGVPFMANVNVENVPKNAHVEIKNFHSLQPFNTLRFSQSESRIISGNQTVSKLIYSYLLEGAIEGTYTLGPVSLIIDGKTYSSNTQALRVAQQEAVSGDQQKTKHAWLEVSIDREEPFFVNQAIPLSITLYIDSESQFVNFIQPNFPGFTSKGFEQPREKVTTVDGKQYHTITLSTSLSTQQPGDHVLPAIHARVNIPQDSFGGFGGFISSMFLQEKRISSPGTRLTVSPLPGRIPFPLFVVGTITSMDLSFDHTTAHEGEGIVAKLTITGNPHDIKYIKAPSLNLPDELKSYESTASYDAQAGTKTFEYIIQGMKPGAFRIEDQFIHIFDTQKQTYAVLRTHFYRQKDYDGPLKEPIKITILPGTFAGETQLPSIPHEDIHSNTQTFIPLVDGPWHYEQQRMLPWRWIIMGMLLGFGYLILLLLLKFIGWYRRRYWRELRKKHAFPGARKSLALFEQQHDVTGLYHLFVKLFAARAGIEEPVVTQELIATQLEQAGVAEDKIPQWSEFFALVMQARYFSPDAQAQSLFARARYWIIELEDKI